MKQNFLQVLGKMHKTDAEIHSLLSILISFLIAKQIGNRLDPFKTRSGQYPKSNVSFTNELLQRVLVVQDVEIFMSAKFHNS